MILFKIIYLLKYNIQIFMFFRYFKHFPYKNNFKNYLIISFIMKWNVIHLSLISAAPLVLKYRIVFCLTKIWMDNLSNVSFLVTIFSVTTVNVSLCSHVLIKVHSVLFVVEYFSTHGRNFHPESMPISQTT